MVVIGEGSKMDYAIRLAEKFGQIVADMVMKADFQALYELGNRTNAEAASRGLPHEEPVAFLPPDLKPEDFKLEERDG